MKQNIPTARFQEQEADQLIAAFGIKPSPEKREEMKTILRDQKGKFMEIEREREARKHLER